MARELPHNNEAEQAILGALLVYPSVVKVVYDQNLIMDDFFVEAHKRIYDAMLYLMNNHNPIDPTTLLARLQDSDELSYAGGADYIVNLSDSAVSSANITYYIEIVQKKAYARHLIETAEMIAEEGFDSSIDLDELMDKAERSILNVTRKRNATNFKGSREVIGNVMEEINNLRNSSDGITGIETGYRDIDKLTNGLQRGDLIILAARPSMGKTAFALNLALNASLSTKNKGAVALFSLEMPAEQYMRRILSAKSQVEGNKLRSGQVRSDEMNKLSEAANELAALKIFIDDSAIVKMPEIFSKCRKLQSEHGLDLIVVDYLQLITSAGKESRQLEISEISRSLKALARELEVPVLALSQLSRGVESRQDKRPMLSDLRDSGAIEQDADIVVFLYRDDYYDRENDSDESITEVDVQKHRNGALKKIKLQFKKSINAFYTVDQFEEY